MRQELSSIVSKTQTAKHENTGSKTPLAHQVTGEVFWFCFVLFFAFLSLVSGLCWNIVGMILSLLPQMRLTGCCRASVRRS